MPVPSQLRVSDQAWLAGLADVDDDVGVAPAQGVLLVAGDQSRSR